MDCRATCSARHPILHQGSRTVRQSAASAGLADLMGSHRVVKSYQASIVNYCLICLEAGRPSVGLCLVALVYTDCNLSFLKSIPAARLRIVMPFSGEECRMHAVRSCRRRDVGHLHASHRRVLRSCMMINRSELLVLLMRFS